MFYSCSLDPIYNLNHPVRVVLKLRFYRKFSMMTGEVQASIYLESELNQVKVENLQV